MFVSIHSPLLKEVASGRLRGARIRLRWRSGLSPRVSYTLRLYSEEDDRLRRWIPDEELRDVQVLERCDDPTPGGIHPPAPEGSQRLVCKIRFEVDNDLPIPRMIRWRFKSQESGSDVLAWRIPLLVRPTVSRIAIVVIPTVALLGITQVFDAWTRSALTPDRAWQLTRASLIFLIGGMALMWTVSRFWKPRE